MTQTRCGRCAKKPMVACWRGDLGYQGKPAAELLAQEAELVLITRRDAPARKFLLGQVRQAIETSFSVLLTKHLF